MSIILKAFFIFSVSVSALEQPSLSNLNPLVYTDFDQYTYTRSSGASNSLVKYHIEGNYNSTGRPYSAYVAVFSADSFAFYPPEKSGCDQLIKTSQSSSQNYNCDYATNGAFFTWDTSASLCIGNLISDGKTWQLPTDGSGTGRANFGIASNGDTTEGSIYTGFIDADVISSANFTNLITGYGWLVRKGESYVNQSQDLTYKPGGFTLEKAPRTVRIIINN